MKYLTLWMFLLTSIHSTIFRELVSYATDDISKEQAEGSGIALTDIESMGSMTNSISHGKRLTMNHIPINVRSTTPEDAKFYFPVIGYSYCPTQQVAMFRGNYVKRIGPGVRLQKIIYHKELEVQVLLLTNTNTNEIVVAFSGSQTATNYLTDLRLDMVPFLNSRMKVHEGFKVVSDALLPWVNDALQALLSHPNYESYTTTFVGHSLGGSAALLTILRTKVQLDIPWSDIKVITYGQPRTGNPAFVRFVNNLPFSLTRVVNQNDIVPHLPLTFSGYVHTYHELYFTKHAIRTCSTRTLEDPHCSNSQHPHFTPLVHNDLQGQHNDNSQCV